VVYVVTVLIYCVVKRRKRKPQSSDDTSLGSVESVSANTSVYASLKTARNYDVGRISTMCDDVYAAGDDSVYTAPSSQAPSTSVYAAPSAGGSVYAAPQSPRAASDGGVYTAPSARGQAFPYVPTPATDLLYANVNEQDSQRSAIT
jgi:hypothetical protein